MPRFEREIDREREQVVRNSLSWMFGLPVRGRDDLCETDDYAVWGNELIFVNETKCRNFDWGEHPTVYLSLAKYNALMKYDGVARALLFSVGCEWHSLTHMPTRIFVADLSGLDLSQFYVEENSGRTLRTRPDAVHDIETIIHVPNHMFIETPVMYGGGYGSA